jgi:hypothetical protein
MVDPIPSVMLPVCQNADREAGWLQVNLLDWLDHEFLPEPVNQKIAKRASEVFFRHRLEGENDLNGLVLAILTEMQPFDFSKSFYSEFAIANAVSELLLKSIGVDTCCGNE